MRMKMKALALIATMLGAGPAQTAKTFEAPLFINDVEYGSALAVIDVDFGGPLKSGRKYAFDVRAAGTQFKRGAVATNYTLVAGIVDSGQYYDIDYYLDGYVECSTGIGSCLVSDKYAIAGSVGIAVSANRINGFVDLTVPDLSYRPPLDCDLCSYGSEFYYHVATVGFEYEPVRNYTPEFRLFVTEVPEPAMWAMMIGGVGAVGGALRRRRARWTLSKV